MSYIVKTIAYEKDLAGKRVLVTAGPTREAIDPVRYITNYSTGKMGYAIAHAAMLRGAEVTLVTGPSMEKLPDFVRVIPVISARDMYEAVEENFARQDMIIKAAAVADYRPAVIATEKVKKSAGQLSIELERTDDILELIGKHRREGQIVCGFSMETEHLLENSRKKLRSKKVDMIVANNVKESGAGFGSDTNIVTMITAESESALPVLSKDEVAHRILDAMKQLKK